LHKPANRRQLSAFIRAHFGIYLPYKTFTPGHGTPFDFVADAFFHPGRDLAAWANRSGIKTLGASILAALEFLYTDNLQARVLSGSEDQALCLYEYWQRWCGTVLRERLSGPVRKLETHLAGGRFEILATSQKQVRGPKVHRLYEDELDEIDSDIDRAAVGMIASSPLIPARTLYTSTCHRVGGPMGRLIEACPGNGVTLRKWNIWESIERCPRERHLDGRGCSECRLGGVCLAKAREFYADADRGIGIAADAMGLHRIDDAIKAISKVGRATWEAEWECRRPSAQGLVYPQFDPLLHRCDEPPADLTIYRSVDWGEGVFVCLWLGEDAEGRVYLLDTYCCEHGTIHQHAQHINAHRLQDVRATYCDPAGRNRNDQTGRSNVQVFRSSGIACSYTLAPAAREVRNGIELVRAALEPAAGRARFFYVPGDNNRIFVQAMQNYRSRKVNGVWIDQPQDPQEFEHIPDALRYFFVNRRRGGAVSVIHLRTS